ncbi:hypothetical protein PtA15_2A879 [Puccinia triticina]|uniref:CST complex subunit STN1 n=1 Tax=Puccinia triticina TaxID=208348 RepID=A0ABY7CF51_9BASI|nr:uncharacterized protein PtA15_2A879 [Puccinia triticina]WAQ82562.1 hypothetical protein PtA15_2A879 [Puccinia triticina]WAR53413.1 hypothetical protein PtB15_2B844 [Puccinia triticina]
MPPPCPEPLRRENITIDLTTPSPPPRKPASSPLFPIPTVYSQPPPSRTRTPPTTRQPAFFVISDGSDHEPPSPHPRTPPQPHRAHTPAGEPSPASSSSTTDAAHVERSLLQHTLLLQEEPPPPTPPPRFLPSDIKLLNAYLCRPISTVMATCSSLIIPPRQIPGLPPDKLETLYAKDTWRIKPESLAAPGMSQKVACWMYGHGWPAKTFLISGWLVGVDRRERFITYHIDDGTAVLECQINIAQLNKAFDSTSQEYSRLPHEKEPPQKSRDASAQEECPDQSASSSSPAPTPKPRSDPRLDPYRRLPSPDRKSHTTRATATHALEPPQLENPVAEAVTEETIAKYAALKIGIVLRLVGRPKSLFRDTKRVLDLERVIIVQDNQDEEEIRFRQHVKYCRTHIYNQPFRLSNVWPEGVKSLGPGHSHSTHFFPKSSTAVTSQQPVEKEKETRRLKLPPVSRLTPQQLTFSNYLNYVSHYIVSRYDDDASKTTYSYHELKRKIDRSEAIVLDDFSIDDLLEEGPKDDRHGGLRAEMGQFTAKLVAQQAQEGPERQASDCERPAKKQRQQQGVFLTDADRHRLSRKTLGSNKALVTRAIQALVNQGTIIISPTDERRFAIPNLASLGPKILHIINTTTLPPPDPTATSVSVNAILRGLARDELWKAVHRETVVAVLRRLQLRQTGPDSWRIP